jgi:pimeloyl-ACP methyl ester carboxylesterase
MQHLLLLHGAIGSKEQLQPLATLLTDHYHVHTLNFDGHGGAALPTGNFSIASFAGNVLAYMKEHGVSNAHVFGYSMGGYVGMYLAKHHPLSIKSLVTLATKYYWDPAVAANEVRMLDSDTIRQKVPIFAAQLEQRHAPVDWSIT